MHGLVYFNICHFCIIFIIIYNLIFESIIFIPTLIRKNHLMGAAISVYSQNWNGDRYMGKVFNIFIFKITFIVTSINPDRLFR